jgi:uncharacterized membrane protein
MTDQPSTKPLSPQLNPEGPSASTTVVQRRLQFTGPLPPPGILEQYEKICPGTAARIIDAAGTEGLHRHNCESNALDANIEAMRRQFAEARLGQVFALIIALAFVIVGAYVSVHGQPWSGTILGGVGLGGVVTAFIVGRNKQDSHKESSAEEPRQSRP